MRLKFDDFAIIWDSDLALYAFFFNKFTKILTTYARVIYGVHMYGDDSRAIKHFCGVSYVGFAHYDTVVRKCQHASVARFM